MVYKTCALKERKGIRLSERDMAISYEGLRGKKDLRLNLSINQEIKRLIGVLAESEGLSRNEYIARLVIRDAEAHFGK